MSEHLIAIDAGALPREERFNEQVGRPLFRKNLMTDLETGMEVRLVRYPAGFVNRRHTHPCAHGMYVLDGILTTHDGVYGPGHFVWFPEGMVMEHGAMDRTTRPRPKPRFSPVSGQSWAWVIQTSEPPVWLPDSGWLSANEVDQRPLAQELIGRAASYLLHALRANCRTFSQRPRTARAWPRFIGWVLPYQSAFGKLGRK